MVRHRTLKFCTKYGNEAIRDNRFERFIEELSTFNGGQPLYFLKAGEVLGYSKEGGLVKMNDGEVVARVPRLPDISLGPTIEALISVIGRGDGTVGNPYVYNTELSKYYDSEGMKAVNTI